MFSALPLAEVKVTSSYGMRDLDGDGTFTLRAGTDFRAPVGTPLFAMGTGVIRGAGLGAGGNGGGLAVDFVDDDDGRLVYLHMSRVDVAPGQRVTAGQLLGLSGATGAVFGPHLHLQWQPAGSGTSTADIAPVVASLLAAGGGGGGGLVVVGVGVAVGAWLLLRKKKGRR